MMNSIDTHAGRPVARSREPRVHAFEPEGLHPHAGTERAWGQKVLSLEAHAEAEHACLASKDAGSAPEGKIGPLPDPSACGGPLWLRWTAKEGLPCWYATA